MTGTAAVLLAVSISTLFGAATVAPLTSATTLLFAALGLEAAAMVARPALRQRLVGTRAMDLNFMITLDELERPEAAT